MAFYKFLSPVGARLTLESGRFKHSKPSDFNDVEDLTIQSIFPEDTEEALEKIRDCLPDIILSNLDATFTYDSPLKPQLRAIQLGLRANPSAIGAIKEELSRTPITEIYDVGHMEAEALDFIEVMNRHLQDYRVLCVTDDVTSRLMWERYAANESGVALRISPNIEKDSKFRLFREVDYMEHRPPLYSSVVGFVENSLFGDRQARVDDPVAKIIYTKTSEWADEREFRLAIPLRQGEQPWDTLPFHPEEVSEIYFGPEINVDDRRVFSELALRLNPSILMFDCNPVNEEKMMIVPASYPSV